MQTVTAIDALRREVAALRGQGGRIAFVPTMGNLHDAHLELVRLARRHADAVVVSIFVNPMQFGANEDFGDYPRTPAEDRQALEGQGAALLFMPEVDTVYPRGLESQTYVTVPGLGEILEGASRPGHFRGVATVVNRLFNLVGPDLAVFGKKDYQQWLVIRAMVADLGMPIEIVGAETRREPDGLAMSSRNLYLASTERRTAPVLYATLCRLRDRIQADGGASPAAVDAARRALVERGFVTDYLVVRRQGDLQAPASGDRQLVVLAAARLGRTRLIDNLEVEI